MRRCFILAMDYLQMDVPVILGKWIDDRLDTLRRNVIEEPVPSARWAPSDLLGIFEIGETGEMLPFLEESLLYATTAIEAMPQSLHAHSILSGGCKYLFGQYDRASARFRKLFLRILASKACNADEYTYQETALEIDGARVIEECLQDEIDAFSGRKDEIRRNLFCGMRSLRLHGESTLLYATVNALVLLPEVVADLQIDARRCARIAEDNSRKRKLSEM